MLVPCSPQKESSLHVLFALWEKSYIKYDSLKSALKFHLAEKLISKFEDKFWTEEKFINYAWHVYKFFENSACDYLWSDSLSLCSHMSHIAFLPRGDHIALFVILWSCMKW